MATSASPQGPVLPFALSHEKKAASGSIASDHSLLEIDRELDMLFDKMQDELEETGEASPESIERFHSFCDAYGEKVDRIGRFIRVMEARTAYCKAEAARLVARGKIAENKVEQTKLLILYYLQSREITRMEGKQFTLRCQKNSQDSVRISDPELIPLRLKRIEAHFDGGTWERIVAALPDELKSILNASVQDIIPMNDAIKQAFAQGDAVDGATVTRGHHVRVA
ncbi:viral Gp157 protein [Edaphobacter aggregans]|uniref:Viral Gp157 protein n=1 Tax=Edaphobacter aggregans TaxID=570835 RepID=A0A428MP13_9BACT|nr:siphovirus Gp157 family protein [Edaphobacter aggregans]RSL18610.1 viral Gp157 protein [Edaphobacter aggregans]